MMGVGLSRSLDYYLNVAAYHTEYVNGTTGMRGIFHSEATCTEITGFFSGIGIHHDKGFNLLYAHLLSAYIDEYNIMYAFETNI